MSNDTHLETGHQGCYSHRHRTMRGLSSYSLNKKLCNFLSFSRNIGYRSYSNTVATEIKYCSSCKDVAVLKIIFNCGVLFSISRPSNTKEARSHSRPDKDRGYKRTREPSPEQLPPVEDEEDEEEYQQDYSPSSPQHYSQQYNHRNSGGYQSEEYESPVEEPVPSLPQKQTGHSKPHREQGREHGSHSSREQERRNRPAQVPREAQNRHDNREQKETTTPPSSKRSHPSSIQESRKGKKRVSEGKCLKFCLAVSWTAY